MINSDNLCMGCMREIGEEEKKCPHCGYHIQTVQNVPYLPVRTVVLNRYLVGKAMETNGEGVTYIGWDINEKKAVFIREFNPFSFTARTESNLNLQVMLGSEATFAEFRRSFETLWTQLEKLSGLSALINVTNVFECFGTSYAVYDHFDGISLRDFLLRSKTGYISWEKARQLLMPTLSTIGNLHSNGIIHRGISPTTLIIAEDGKIKITGFSIGEVRTAGSHLDPQIYEGYAAVEQYGFDAPQGPWTDVYSFAAVLYRTLIGSDPISAKERISNDRLMVPGKFAEALPAYVINALINALQILPQDRTRNVEQLRGELSATPSASAAGAAYTRQKNSRTEQTPASPRSNTPPKKKKSPVATMFLTALIIIFVGIAVFGALAATVFKDKFNVKVGGGETTVTQAAKIAVPQFAERSYYDIQQNPVFNKNFKITVEEVYNSDIEAGYVITQSIESGTMVDPGTEIKLFVSKGGEMVELPNIVGEIYETAEMRLAQLGFVCKKQETTEGNHSFNEVIMMSPVAGKKYSKGTEVTLMVYVQETEVPHNDEGNSEIDSASFSSQPAEPQTEYSDPEITYDYYDSTTGA